MASKGSLIIIGAGIAGLAAGIYARKNGYHTTIFEMHDKPGGMCTSWRRGEFVLDYSIHNLAGTGKDSGLRKVWDELGALDGLDVIDHEEFVRIENYDGRSFTMYSDIDRTIAELRRVSPEDEELIRAHERMARKFARLDVFAALLGGTGMLRMLPHLRTLSKLTKITLEDQAAQFSDPFLRKAFPALQYGFSNIPLAVHYIFQGGLDRGDLGAIKGGSLRFSQSLESRYLELGGQIRYRKKVAKVLVRETRAVGVRLDDGSEHYADVVISAADGRTTIFDMLDGRFKDDLIQDYYNGGWWPREQEMGASIFLGVRRDLSKEPHALALLLKTPSTINGKELSRLDLELFSSSSGMAPEGKGIIKVNMPCDYDLWKALKNKGNAYDEAKEEAIANTIAALETRFPGLGQQVETTDMTTLLTCERYVGDFRGLQPWGSKRDQSRIMRKGLSRTLPGLDNFYMVGQWAEASIGLPTAAVSGRRAIRSMCKKDGMRFKG